MEHLSGVVERITFRNEENGYSVIKCRAEDYSDLVTIVGSMPEVHVGSYFNFGGDWKYNPKYGTQFAMKTSEETLPATAHGIEKYLGSGLIKGIGTEYAKKIVRQFGKDTLNVIEDDPDKLLKIPGIGQKRVDRIKQSWNEQQEVRNIMLFLQSYDVSTSLATRIYKAYGNVSIKIVRENPYRLADDIWGIGFKKADAIAEKMGFGHEKYARLRSGILYTLKKLSEEGHCYATKDMLLKTGSELLDVEDNLLSNALDEMIRAKDVYIDEIPDSEEEAIYLPSFYFAETGTVGRLKAIYENPQNLSIRTYGLTEHLEQTSGRRYDSVQEQAIISAVQNKVMILTGGPGTGKTYTTLGIIKVLKKAGANILLAAPTGRAAKRLSEVTGMEAKTIHRLLEMNPHEGFLKDEDNPLDGDVLIIDECSMIDIMLMYNLLKAVPDNMSVILVGDVDQLPSVGAGNVLRDIIDSGCFPVVRLTHIFRQAQGSQIIMNAHRINQGKMPYINNDKDTDFIFIDMANAEAKDELTAQDSVAIAELSSKEIVDLVKNRLPEKYHASSHDIQVLTPMRRGDVGTVNLNQKLQEAINPGSYGLKRGGVQYRPGDKVMQIRNNYDKDVFNGDIGFISDVDLDENSLCVDFDGHEVEYDISELDELVLAYATTIHKSQGSEYPIVVLPILMNHYIMLQRNLIYTGITRAKKLLVIVGTTKALAYAIKNVTVDNRNTLLKERLQKAMLKKA